MAGCVNTKAPEFKEQAKRLNISEGSLENIIHEYQESVGKSDFPADSYVLSKVEGAPNIVKAEDLSKATEIWEHQYSQPIIFSDFNSAQAYKAEVSQFFSPEAIGLKERPDGKFVVTVQKPQEGEVKVEINVPIAGEVSVSKVISGGQTGVDTIGLQVAKALGIETGGTAPKGFLREQGIDNEDISSYGLKEISDEEQADYTKRKGKADPYTGRTELNVRNSDGTVYFSTEEDPRGLIATKRAADEFGKPFLQNPTAEQLRQWIIDNNIKTLNVAGNRGSKLKDSEAVKNVLMKALGKQEQQPASSSQVRLENQAFLQKSASFMKQVGNLLDSSEISATEVRHIAEQVVYKISDLLTDYQQHPEHLFVNFPDLGTANREEDIKRIPTMSRAELVSYIGAQRLLEGIKNLMFDSNEFLNRDDTEMSTLDKASLLSENFDALVKLAADTFAQMEDFAIVSVDNNYEIVEDLNVDADNFNESNEEDSIKENEGNLQEHWQVESRTLDVFNNATKLVKRALGQLFQRNPDGTIKQSEFGINERVTPRDATESLLHWTEGSLTLADMVNKMKEKSSEHPWLNDLIYRLEDTSGAEADFQSQFFTTFAKHKQTYSIVTLEDGKYVSKVVNNAPAMRDAINQINAAVKSGTAPLFTSEGISRGKLAAMSSFSERLKAGRASKFEGINYDNISESISKICGWLGYFIDTESVKKVLNPESLAKMSDALSYMVQSLQLSQNNKTYDPLNFKDKNSIRGNLIKFLEPIVAQFEDTAISSFYDSGKMYQTYVTPSYLSKLFIKFHSDEQSFRDFIQNEYGNYGWFYNKETGEWRNPWLGVLSRMSASERGKMFAHKVELNFNKHNYMRNMSDSEYAISLIQEYWSEKSGDKGVKTAWYRLPMISNKPSSEFIRFVRYSDTFYKDTITDGIMEIFGQEMSRIQTVKERNLDSKDPRFIKNFDKNGKRFVMLDFLNSNKELMKLVDKKTSGQELTSEELLALDTIARDAIRTFMDAKAKDIVARWAQNGILEAAAKVDNITSDFATVEEALENYVWNDTFAAMNILELTITDPAYYKDAEDLQKRLAQLHAPGVRANVVATDYEGNRVTDGFSRSLVLTDFDDVLSNIIDNVSIVFDRRIAQAPESQKAALQALKESLVGENGAYRQINVADAQAYSSPTSYRKKAFLFGKWDAHSEEIYQKLRSGDYKFNDLQTAFQPLKPFVYSQVGMPSGVNTTMTDLKVPVQFKNSEYLLIMADAITRGEDTGKPNILRAIYDVMEESARTDPQRGLDTVQFESAVKSGLHGRINIKQFADAENGEVLAKRTLEEAIYSNWRAVDTGNGRILKVHDGEYNKTFVTEVPWEDYCLQQEVPEHFKNHEQAWGSQIRYITISDLVSADYLGNPVKFDFNDAGTHKSLTPEEFKAEYEANAAENITESIETIARELGIGDYYLSRADRNIAISKILQREILSSPRYGVDLLQACSVDENGNFRIPLGDPIQSKRIEQLLNSIIKNRINKQEIAGGPIVQVSNFGTSKQLNIRFKDKDGNLLKTRAEFGEGDYEAYIKENQAGIAYYECYVPIYTNDLFEKFADKDGNIDIDAIERVNPDLLKLIGYRIPSEAKYSMAPLKIVGFMPREAGDGIMMPYDITLLTGSDFDVDKFYIMRKDIKINSNAPSDVNVRNRQSIAKKLAEIDPEVAKMQLSTERLQKIQETVDTKYDAKIADLNRRKDAEISAMQERYEQLTDANEERNLIDDKVYDNTDKWLDKQTKKIERRYSLRITELEEKAIAERESIIERETQEMKEEAVKDFLQNPMTDSNDIIKRSLKSSYLNMMYKATEPSSGRVYRNNKIVDMTWAVLTHETTAAEMLNPGGFDPQKRMGYMVAAMRNPANTHSWEELSKMSIQELKDASYQSKNLCFPDVQIDFYRQNSAAGSILGMFAVQRVAHAALESSGLVITTEQLLPQAIHIGDFTISEVMDIDPQTDNTGTTVGKVLGSLVASAADAVKDPVLNLMNINSNTANVLTTLIRLGCSFDTAAMFTSQQAIADALSEFNRQNISGKFTRLEEVMRRRVDELEKTFGDTTVAVEGLTEQDMIDGINPQGLSQTERDILEYKTLKLFMQVSSIASAMKGTTFATRFNSITSAAGPLIIDNLISKHKEEQFSQYIGIKERKFTMANTGQEVKVGDTILLAGKYVKLTAPLIDELLSAGTLEASTEVKFDVGADEAIYDRHPILAGFKNAKHLADKMFKEMPANGKMFESVLESIPDNLVETIYGDRKLLGQLSDFYQSYMLLASGAVKEGELAFYMKEFPTRFMKAGYKAKYKNNPFIQAIQQDIKNGRIILKVDTTGMDTQTKERLISGWADFHKAEPQASLQLFYYNFFRGGIGFSPETFMNLVPTYVKERIPMYRETYSMEHSVDGSTVFEQFVRNNVGNNKLVPENTFKITGRESSTVMIVEDTPLSRSTPYIKIKTDNGYALYRNVSEPADAVKFQRIDILGNNGEYFEASYDKSNPQAIENSFAPQQATEKTTDVVDAPVDVPAENTRPIKSNNDETEMIQALLDKLISKDGQVKARNTSPATLNNPRVQELWKNSLRERARQNLGVELNDTEVERLFKTLCGPRF